MNKLPQQQQQEEETKTTTTTKIKQQQQKTIKQNQAENPDEIQRVPTPRWWENPGSVSPSSFKHKGA